MWYIRKEDRGKFASVEERSWFFWSLIKFDLRRDALEYIKENFPLSSCRVIAVNGVVVKSC